MRDVRKGDGGVMLQRTAFEVFYHDVYLPALDRVSTVDSGPVFSNGHDIRGASWDRRSAYLLFLMRPEARDLLVSDEPDFSQPAPVKAPPAPTLASVEDEFG